MRSGVSGGWSINKTINRKQVFTKSYRSLSNIARDDVIIKIAINREVLFTKSNSSQGKSINFERV